MKNMFIASLMAFAIPALAADGMQLIPTHVNAKEFLVREHKDTGVVEYQATDGGWIQAKTVSVQQAALATEKEMTKVSAIDSGEAKIQKVDYYGGRPRARQEPIDPGYGQEEPIYEEPCVQPCGPPPVIIDPAPCMEPCNDPPPCDDYCGRGGYGGYGGCGNACGNGGWNGRYPTPYIQPNYYSNGYVVRQRRILRPVQQWPQGQHQYRRFRVPRR